MADCFDVQSALQDAKCRVFTGLSRRVQPARRGALVFTFDDGGEIEIPGSTPDYLIMAAAVFESGVRVGGVYVHEMLNDVTDVALTTPTGVKIARVRLMKPPSHMAEDRGDIRRRLEGRKIEAARLADGVVFTEEADGLTGVFVQWRFLDLPVDRINDWGNKVSIMTEEGAAVEILFRKEDGND